LGLIVPKAGVARRTMDILLWLITAYLAICATAYFGNRLLMYFPDPARISPAEAGLSDVEEIALEAADGTRLVAWYAAAKDGKPTLLYLHGNGANAAARAGKIERILPSGIGLFYLNNRGYGGSAGKPTEANNVADAIAAYDHLRRLGVPAERIVAYGESLGTGQAVRLAAKRPVAGVVLEAPLTSTVDVGRSTHFWLPLSLLITDQYNVERDIASVTVPVLILHGERDEVIPVEMGRRNYRAANEPKRIETFPQGTHSDLFDHGAWETARDFVLSLNGR
jgi:fermentation-respiration switch protein FrsA (DUF1100 family)